MRPPTAASTVTSNIGNTSKNDVNQRHITEALREKLRDFSVRSAADTLVGLISTISGCALQAFLEREDAPSDQFAPKRSPAASILAPDYVQMGSAVDHPAFSRTLSSGTLEVGLDVKEPVLRGRVTAYSSSNQNPQNQPNHMSTLLLNQPTKALCAYSIWDQEGRRSTTG